MVREVTLRCSNCNCGVKIEERKLNENAPITKSIDLLFTVVKNGKDES
jgi:hypothetical protein